MWGKRRGDLVAILRLIWNHSKKRNSILSPKILENTPCRSEETTGKERTKSICRSKSVVLKRQLFQGKEGKKEGRGTFSKMLGKWKLREDTHTHILQDKRICKDILIKGHKTLFPTASTPPKRLSLKGPYLTALKGEVLLN